MRSGWFSPFHSPSSFSPKETLAFATMAEFLLGLKEIMYMARKPKHLGLLIWMLMICFDYTGLPYTYCFEAYRYFSRLSCLAFTLSADNRLSPTEAIQKLILRRLKESPVIPYFLVDSGFTSSEIIESVLRYSSPSSHFC